MIDQKKYSNTIQIRLDYWLVLVMGMINFFNIKNIKVLLPCFIIIKKNIINSKYDIYQTIYIYFLDIDTVMYQSKFVFNY